MLSGTALVILLALSLATARPVSASPCAVPGDRDSIGSAIADPNCDTVLLGATVYEETIEVARNVAVVGAGSAQTTVTGQVTVIGTADVQISAITIDTSTPSLVGCRAVQITSDARLSTSDVKLLSAAGRCNNIFSDGFESSDITRWDRRLVMRAQANTPSQPNGRPRNPGPFSTLKEHSVEIHGNVHVDSLACSDDHARGARRRARTPSSSRSRRVASITRPWSRAAAPRSAGAPSKTPAPTRSPSTTSVTGLRS